MARKKHRHNQELYPKQNVSHGVIILAIIAYFGEKDVPTSDIFDLWSEMVVTTDPYNHLTRNLFILRKAGYIKTVRKRMDRTTQLQTVGGKGCSTTTKEETSPSGLLNQSRMFTGM